MSNELLLVVSLAGCYSLVLLWYSLFGSRGVICWIVLATIAANIEVMILVDAFGMSQTLGNVMFASTFLATDILSETAGRKRAAQAVNAGILASASFILISQLWLQFTPSPDDYIFPSIRAVFSQTPRIMLVGLVVYAVVQHFDVWAYHWWWRVTEKRFGSRSRFLWLRNNAATLVSQLLNTVLFTVGAFWGTYSPATLLSIGLSSYAVFIVTTLADTPFIYAAKILHDRKKKRI